MIGPSSQTQRPLLARSSRESRYLTTAIRSKGACRGVATTARLGAGSRSTRRRNNNLSTTLSQKKQISGILFPQMTAADAAYGRITWQQRRLHLKRAPERK